MMEQVVPGATVLIIDDTRENRVLLASQLKIEGYTIIEASGGQMGMEQAQEHDPDVILLDVMMPDLDGFEVCRMLKQDPETHLIPIIMVTALNRVESRIEGKRAGADEFLSRPHVREELLVRVRTYVQIKRARVRLEEERNRLQLLYNISRSISTQLDLDAIMTDALLQTQAAVGATKGNIILLDQTGNMYHRFLIRAGSSVRIRDQLSTDVLTKGLGSWLLETKQSDIVHDITEDERWITLPDDQSESGSAIGIPLLGPERVEGILILNHPQPGYFTAEHQNLLEAIGSTVTAAILNARFFSEIKEEQRKLETILKNSTDAIIITDEEWHISLINHTAAHLFQVEIDDVTGLSLNEIPQLRGIKSIVDELPKQPEAKEISLSNGRILYTSVSPIKGVGYAAILQDITELKEAEEMRVEAERREKERVQATFARYMGPKLIKHVLSYEPGLLSRRERRHAVVMFADIRDYTRFTSMVEPNEVIERLNRFFTTMSDIVYEFDGTIFELTGDEILVGFNAPFDQPDAALRALHTAIAMQQEFNNVRQEWIQSFNEGVGLGIGIDRGEVVVGNVGAESRMTFRMVGDAVNMAHRLVDLAIDGQIVISENVYEQVNSLDPLTLEKTQLKLMGPVGIKGKELPQMLYEITIPRTKSG